ncbi:MAG: DUF3592 domain-containing protein [Bacteroidia bacterium]|nr:DUF3592 domain-containing protein [Bacteroidia bacterium]
MHDKSWLIFCGVFATIGTVCAVIGWYNWQSTSHIVRNGIQVDGWVIENYPHPDRKKRYLYAPVVQFLDKNGEMRKYTSTTFTNPAQFQVGEQIKVWYLEKSPEKVMIPGPDYWLVPAVLGGFGLVFSLIGYPALIRALIKSMLGF